MKKMKFDVYFDPGHGWMKVKMAQLDKLGIRGMISPYSYIRGENAYLEEDCDASTFVSALKDIGIGADFRYHHTDRSSRIRSYAKYPYTIREDFNCHPTIV